MSIHICHNFILFLFLGISVSPFCFHLLYGCQFGISGVPVQLQEIGVLLRSEDGCSCKFRFIIIFINDFNMHGHTFYKNCECFVKILVQFHCFYQSYLFDGCTISQYMYFYVLDFFFLFQKDLHFSPFLKKNHIVTVKYGKKSV